MSALVVPVPNGPADQAASPSSTTRARGARRGAELIDLGLGQQLLARQRSEVLGDHDDIEPTARAMDELHVYAAAVVVQRVGLVAEQVLG